MLVAAIAAMSVNRVTAAEPKAADTQPAAEVVVPMALGSTSEDQAADQAAYAILGMKMKKLDFDGIEFQAVIQFLRDASGASIYVPWNVLRQAGIERTAPVNVHVANVTFEKALKTVLEDVGSTAPLGCVVDGGVITIATKEDFARRVVTKAYDVRDLLAHFPKFVAPSLPAERDQAIASCGNNGPSVSGSAREDKPMLSQGDALLSLIEMLKSTIDTPSWRPTGELADIREFDGLLIITQTAENHARVQRVLWNLEPEWAHNLHAKLRKKVARVNLDKAKFQDAVKFVREAFGVNVVVDPEVPEGSLPPITIQAERLTGEQVLNLITRMAKRRWELADEVVYISNVPPPVMPPATTRPAMQPPPPPGADGPPQGS
jgi:hypothetical protein